MLKLKVISPEKIIFKGEVESVKVPGTQGNFEILTDHAPIISSLEKGQISFTLKDGQQKSCDIAGGFVEVKRNEVNLAVEL